MNKPWKRLASVALVILLPGATPSAPGDRAADQEALRTYAGLVGTWKGTGQPQRNSARGAWRETGQWAWSQTADSAALRWTSEGSPYLRTLTLKPGGGEGRFVAEIRLPDGAVCRFLGQTGARGALVLNPEADAAAALARVTLTPLHDSRFLLLLEGPAEGSATARLGEVGFTRQGVAFAQGDSYPECIVTGGRGTIRVSHAGRDYWVCCTGCKDLFTDDPAGVLADAAARQNKVR